MPFEKGDFNRQQGYINFKYVNGADLIEYITEKKPTQKEKVNILIKAAEALKWLVEVGGYSHGDIAPMFKTCPTNCSFPEQWERYLE